MSCDVADTAFDNSTFHEDWHKAPNNEHHHLSALQDFNAHFDIGQGNSIDPRMTLSSPPSPASSFDSVYNDSGFDPTLGPPPNDDFAYPDFGSPNSPAPYYDLQPVAAKWSPLRNITHSAHFFNAHRRSVSEPPDNLPHHKTPHTADPIGFHRDGHFIGTPVQSGSNARPLKSLPRSKDKTRRQHPYSPTRKDRNRHDRFPPRRAEIQAQRQAPTSAPSPMTARLDIHPLYEPVMPGSYPRYINSRVCNPTPIMTPTADMGGQIDPMLSLMSPVFHGGAAGSGLQEHGRVSIPVTVDQLQAMIVAAVEKAVKGTNGSTPDPTVDAATMESVGKVDNEMELGVTEQCDGAAAVDGDAGVEQPGHAGSEAGVTGEADG